MPNPLGTKEHREELRRHLKACDTLQRDLNHLDDLDVALDGLDITEEMAKHIEHHPMTASGRCTECKRLFRRWQAWERGEQ